MEPLAPTDVQPNAGGEFDTLAPLPSATQLAAMLYKLPDKAIAESLVDRVYNGSLSEENARETVDEIAKRRAEQETTLNDAWSDR